MQQDKEIEIVSVMIKMYCKHYHHTKGELCDECSELLDYVKLRRSKCPFGDNKTFCSNCKVHCYKPEKREKIRKVMRYSGPRIFFTHPIIATKHIIETIKIKRLNKKEQKNVR